ncbi:TetR/AcrR family transcriptional regulator [Pseudonocardia sp. DSM 110487]|uniref:TetR/AcrR family transcriptional regulator n=1 Tax=Pseudonocardia sp. DSM 110487 TaxID=2865833 RepID=UPI001C6A3FFC|nr:TetR/AcrR family transcriptional regulator [Pseudonocardia sp. DSM 110487]QYN34064.1 TetR/AcrR family transcriptional regulator [Pseudonocardia sp. DSM 110487]
MTADRPHGTRMRILRAALDLLTDGGTEAVSTRAVSARAGVQQPALYRLFGDKRGLLEALASFGFERYLAQKEIAHAATGNPLDDLRAGWDAHVAFGVDHPGLYQLMYGTVHSGQRSAAAKEAYEGLLAVMRKLAALGALRTPPDVAAQMIQSAAIGVTLRLIASDGDPASDDLSPGVRDAILAAILVDPAADDHTAESDTLAARAMSLDSRLADQPGHLTPTEAALLREWLRRLATRH